MTYTLSLHDALPIYDYNAIALWERVILTDSLQHIDGFLTTTYNLDCSVREKPVMNVDDVYLVLHYHWVLDVTIFPDGRQQLQVSFLLLISAYTATRPGVLVYV